MSMVSMRLNLLWTCFVLVAAFSAQVWAQPASGSIDSGKAIAQPSGKSTSLVGTGSSPDRDSSKPNGEKVASDENGQTDSDEAVLEFVKQHQPQMAELILYLKKKQPSDYREALKEGRKARDRLMNLKSRDPELYEIELAIWNNSAQLRLLAAEVSAKSKKLNDEDRSKLKALLEKENSLMVNRLTLEKARTEARLTQLSQQLERRQGQPETLLNKSLKNWESRIERSGQKTKSK